MSKVEQEIVTKQVKVSEKTYEALTDLGKKNETYDEIIWRVVESYKKVNK